MKNQINYSRDLHLGSSVILDKKILQNVVAISNIVKVTIDGRNSK